MIRFPGHLHCDVGRGDGIVFAGNAQLAWESNRRDKSRGAHPRGTIMLVSVFGPLPIATPRCIRKFAYLGRYQPPCLARRPAACYQWPVCQSIRGTHIGIKPWSPAGPSTHRGHTETYVRKVIVGFVDHYALDQGNLGRSAPGTTGSGRAWFRKRPASFGKHWRF